MIKKLFKFSLILLGLLSLGLIYMNFIGLETNKFNQLIKDKISKDNKKLELDLNAIKILFKISNLSVNLKIVDPVLIFNRSRIELNQVESNLSIKSIIKQNFSITNLLISTKEINIKEIISIIRSYKNNPELFILQKIVKEGQLIADININFDEKGKIKDDYNIKGLVKNTSLNLLNKKKINLLNFNFRIKNKVYLIDDIKAKFSEVNFVSKSIEIKNVDNNIYVNGFLRNAQSDIKTELLDFILGENINDLKKIDFYSENEFSFNIDKKYKIKDLLINSKIKLNELDYIINVKNLKKYLPNFKNKITLKNNLINLSFKNNQMNLSGEGFFEINDTKDKLEYKLIKKINDEFLFDLKIIFEQNPLLISFLKYEKKNKVKSLLEIKALYKKENIRFNQILLKEKKNEFLIEGLTLNEKLKIDQIDKIKLNFLNKEKTSNIIELERKKKNYYIKGKIFDADTLLYQMLEGNDDDGFSKLFYDLNSTLKINVDKVYLDKKSYLNNVKAKIIFRKSELDNLNLVSKFSDNKELKLTINTNKNNEKITTLFSGNAKPLVKRYKFINGFEEGVLDFYSIKKNKSSNSKLKIYNFKLKEVPALTKILTLASLQGIADLLTGEGIRFDDFEMSFSQKGKLMTIEEIYAIGPAISILMEGYIEAKKLVSLKGTLVPATTINKFIGSIPLLGKILVGKKTGEGVFGVSFKIKGPPKDLKTSVNPIKTLTPRFITRTLEKIKKN